MIQTGMIHRGKILLAAGFVTFNLLQRRKRRMRERTSASGWYTVSQRMSAIRTCWG